MKKDWSLTAPDKAVPQHGPRRRDTQPSCSALPRSRGISGEVSELNHTGTWASASPELLQHLGVLGAHRPGAATTIRHKQGHWSHGVRQDFGHFPPFLHLCYCGGKATVSNEVTKKSSEEQHGADSSSSICGKAPMENIHIQPPQPWGARR